MKNKDSAANIRGIIFTNEDKKALGRKIKGRTARFDPNAIDGDNDGTVQEGTSFERPAGPQNMPKVKPIQVPRREDVPVPSPAPSRPNVPATPQKPRIPQRAQRISGSIGKPEDNTFTPDDNDSLASSLFSDSELTELNDLQDNVLDDLAEKLNTAEDIDKELQDLIDLGNKSTEMNPNDILRRALTGDLSVFDEIDVQEWTNDQGEFKLPKRYEDAGWEYDETTNEFVNPEGARGTTEAIQNWLKDHPFNREARNYEETEWADNEGDSQAARYAPVPWDAKRDKLDQVDWDALRKQAGLSNSQKEDWELTPDELEQRQKNIEEMLGDSNSAKLERAKIWDRVKGGEGWREISPDYPDYHWTLVRDMSRMGAEEDGASKQESRTAERKARSEARDRAINAQAQRLSQRLKNVSSSQELRRELQDMLEEEQNIKKRISNEYQMIRKKNVELWTLGSGLLETMPTKKDAESDVAFSKRMKNWFFETGPLFEKIAEDINFNHDITTATDRAYDFQNAQISLIQDKIQDYKNYFTELQNLTPPPSTGGNIAGSMTSRRGLRIQKPSASPAALDTRELVAIQKDIQKLKQGSFSSGSSKRPPKLNAQENAVLSKMRAAKDFSKAYLKSNKTPKKA